jgi:hypothetical protein
MAADFIEEAAEPLLLRLLAQGLELLAALSEPVHL